MEERRAAVRASQRVRILTGAASQARALGVADVSVGGIVAASRVSRRTFYELFENRESCMLATFEHGLERAAARVLPAYASKRDWRDAIRAGLQALLAFLEDEPAFGGFCVVDAPGAGKSVLRRRAEVLAQLASVVEVGRAGARSEEGLSASAGEMIVGGALALIHRRLLDDDHADLGTLLGELMAAIVRPYLGKVAAEQELRRRRESRGPSAPERAAAVPGIRWTYRTIAAVKAVAAHPGASNRAVGDAAGISDQGQVSKLLSRLQSAGLIENEGGPGAAGLANAWYLSERGREIAAQLWGEPR